MTCRNHSVIPRFFTFLVYLFIHLFLLFLHFVSLRLNRPGAEKIRKTFGMEQTQINITKIRIGF